MHPLYRPGRLFSLAAVTALAVVTAVGCSRAPAPATPGSTTTPPPTATRTSTVDATARPTLTPAPTPPTGTHTGISGVDRIIAAVDAHDVDTLLSLVRMQQVECGTPGKPGEVDQPAPPWPPCAGGEPAGTRVDAFSAAVCGAVWQRDPRAMFRRFVDRVDTLYAVTAGREPPDANSVGPLLDPGEQRIVWSAHPGSDTLGYVLVASAGQVTSMELGCFPPDIATRAYLPAPPRVLLRGPAYAPPTPAPARPPSNPSPVDMSGAPEGTVSGIAEVDAVIAALTSRDVARIRSVLHPSQQECTFALYIGIGGPPQCAPGEQEGDLVDALAGAQCEGYWSRDMDRLAASLADRALTPNDLFAVADGGPSYMPAAHVVLFDPPGFDTIVFMLDSDGGVTGIDYMCATPPATWLASRTGAVILRGPAARPGRVTPTPAAR